MSGEPIEHEARAGGIGGLLIAVVSIFVALALVGVGLFLPPIRLYDRLFAAQYNTLSSVGDTVRTGDGSLSLMALSEGDGFGVRVGGVGLREFTVADSAIAPWIPPLRNAIPYYMALQSPVYHLEYDTRPLSAHRASIEIPPTARPDLLDMYGYHSTIAQWQFIPSRATAEGRMEATLYEKYDYVALFQPAPLTPTVLLSYEVTQLLTPQVAELGAIIAPSGLQPMLTGALTGSLAPGFDVNASYPVMPIIRDFSDPRALDTATVEALISNSTLRTEHARQLASLGGGGFDGVVIDYRGLNSTQRDNFSAFIVELSTQLRRVGLKLGVVVPSASYENGTWNTGAYDWQTIGRVADFVQIRLPLTPLAYVEDSPSDVLAMLAWATGEISRYKLLLGLSALSVRDIDGTQSTIGYDVALAGLGQVVVEADNVNERGIIQPGATLRARLDGQPALAGVEVTLNAPYLDYLNSDGTPRARMWLTTSDALRYRMDIATRFALGGVAFEDLLADGLAEGISEAIEAFEAQVPSAPSPTDLALRWRIEGSDGLIEEITTALGETMQTTLNAPDGNYAVNVAVIGIGQKIESVRSGVAVAMFSPTATPTPLPTATPTPLPTATPTPAPIIPTQAPQPQANVGVPSGGGAFPVVAPGAGSIQLGQFEYGGHVSDAGSGRAIEAMRRAGMTWMKVQIRYYTGGDITQAQGAIAGAKANGFKILLGTVGNASDLGNGGDGYVSGYVNWLATLASMGPDGIEVWNEPNLDREWPKGQISGTSYANMLQRAYSAIKRTNPNVLVISAAPAPTGAEGAYPGSVMNDDNWLRQVVEAGGMGYMDCVGVHYNEGVVSPSQTSGDFRDNYYTRYYPTLINTYWNITGGQKPLCITELGYLSPEGFPFLDSYFGWGQNTTVAQQAAYLAEAAALSSRSGKVKLMIVWNVDFTYYGADPMAGFAMIRPDGSCPACDALARAR